MSRRPQAARELNSSLAKLFKPVVRLAMKQGLRFQEMLEFLKHACLEVATEQLERAGQASNNSRLSVLTGLQRKELSKLAAVEIPSSGAANLLSRIISQWRSDSRYLRAGKPRPLTFEGADSEFAELVRSVSVDLNPYTVLFGLEQSGDLRKSAKQAALISKGYNASKNVLDGMQVLLQDSETMHSAVSQNLFERQKVPNLHITTSYDNICRKDLAAIRLWLVKKGAAFHEEVRSFLSRHDKDSNQRLFGEVGGARVSVTAVSFSEEGINADE